MDDHELLRDYVEHHSERAFSALVERHLPFVYGTALRLMQDAAAAEDVAQNVFIALARKAWTVRPGTLPGWLYRATQRAAYMSIRTENRRRQRETAAMNLAEQNHDVAANWETLAPLLDDALRQLSRVEQDALLLRYFDGQSMSETGRLLSLSEPAAQMRVSRALEKMRAYFARQGVTASAALLAATLGTNAATPPPAGLAGKITPPALAGAAGPAGSAEIYVLLRFLFMSTKTKSILTIAAVATLIALTITGLWWYSRPAPMSVKVASVPASFKYPIDPKSPALHPPPLELVVPSPALLHAPQPSDSAAPSAVSTADPQTDLMTLLPEMAKLARTSGMAAVYLKYSLIDKIDPQTLQGWKDEVGESQDSYDLIIDEALSQSLESLLGQTPIFNAAGDEATYVRTVPAVPDTIPKPITMPMVMVKINGKWFIKLVPLLPDDVSIPTPPSISVVK